MLPCCFRRLIFSPLFQLLVEILLDHSNFKVMMRYIQEKDNLKLMMNLLRDPSPNIRLEAFHLFKVCQSHMSSYCVFWWVMRAMQLIHSSCTAACHLSMSLGVGCKIIIILLGPPH